MKRKVLMATIFGALLCAGAYANNITTSNVKLIGQNAGANTTQVQFDITWDNSWRTSSGPANWDAAWIFIKYRVNGLGEWKPAYINNAGNLAPSGSTMNIGLLTPGAAFNATTNPGMGAFLYRSANGSGTFTAIAAQLQWNYGANNVNDNDLVDVQVYAIEQVYVPQGSFSIGSGAGSSSANEYGSFYAAPSDANPFKIAGESAITVANSAGNLFYSVGGGDQAGPIPNAFPKGFAAFYCMKYELSQQGYVDFLNSLTYQQSHLRYDYNSTIGKNRFAIDTVTGNSNFISRAPYIACNFLSWADLSAYLAWAGLRPMSELEFEKACRGTLTPVPNENAWGTGGTANHYYTITNRDANSEYISSGFSSSTFGLGNVSCFNTVGAVLSPTPGPLRVGIFAASADTTGGVSRVTVGATFYGIMEMSGNVYEQLVTVGNTQGRSYTGTHGNGLLDASALAANTDWPSQTTGIGRGIKGGSWNSPNSIDSLSVSNRRFATAGSISRSPYVGGRGVRTAP